MTLEQATADLNAIALRFAEFAIADREAIEAWSAVASTPISADIRLSNMAKHQRRAERNEREAQSILFVLLKLSELTEEKTNGCRRRSGTEDTHSEPAAAVASG